MVAKSKIIIVTFIRNYSNPYVPNGFVHRFLSGGPSFIVGTLGQILDHYLIFMNSSEQIK